MGWWSGSYKLMPGVSEDIGRYSDLAGRARQYGETVGLGMAGRQAKGILKAMGKGDWDTNPVLGAYLNPIRNQMEVNRRELTRRAGMGVNRIAPGQQAGLLNAQTNLASARAEEGGNLAMQSMIPQLFETASGIYSGARGQRIGAEMGALGMESDIDRAINEARMRGTYRTGGLKGALGDIAGIAGAFAGLPGVGGLMRGVPGVGGGAPLRAQGYARTTGIGGFPA